MTDYLLCYTLGAGEDHSPRGGAELLQTDLLFPLGGCEAGEEPHGALVLSLLNSLLIILLYILTKCFFHKTNSY